MTLTQEAFLPSVWNPHQYQKRAVKMMLSQAAVGLFLDPGLGKTSIVLAAFKILKEQGLVSRMLIVAPLRPCYKVWPDEIEKWADFCSLRWTILHGPGKEAKVDYDADIYIINPEGLLWLFQPNQRKPKFDILCIDESSKFKDSTTKRFRLLRPFIPNFKRRWILTGTPVPNGLMDLFGQIYILDLGRSLGRYITHYRAMYFQASGYGLYNWSPRQGAMEEVVEKIKPLILQLSAEDYLKMPELVYRQVSVALPPAAWKIYQEVENNFISLLADEEYVVAANAAVAGGKCRQIANGAVYTSTISRKWERVHDEKLDALEDILEELGNTPVLILYEFDHDRQRILSRLGSVPVLNSGLKTKELDRVIDGFNDGTIPRIIGHPASMGYGLNLQGICHHVIWFSIPWNLEHYDQAIARVYRQGQKSGRVYVYHISASHTKDTEVLDVLVKKDRTQQDLLKAIGVPDETTF